MRFGVVHGQAGKIPDTDHVVEVLVVGEKIRRTEKGLIAHGERDLAEVVVEQCIRLVMRRPVGCPPGNQHCCTHGAEQGEQEVASDRFHGNSGTR